jgi:hypothetical protein
MRPPATSRADAPFPATPQRLLPMNARLLADAVVAVHLAFIVFVVAGGLLVLWRRGWAVLHLPAVAWGAWTEFTGTLCPLTPWEQSLRQQAGAAGYAGGFVEHYLVPLIYPAALTPGLQFALGAFVLLVNAAIYLGVWRRRQRERRGHDGAAGGRRAQ